MSCFKLHYRSASAAEDESFETDLEQQLEDELKLEELMKHRQEPDKTCMVRLRWMFLNYLTLVRTYSNLLYMLWRCPCCGTGDAAAVTILAQVTGK